MILENPESNVKLLTPIPDFNDSVAKILNLLNNLNSFLLTTHINPDGDAVGSCLALYHYLRQKNKNCSIFFHSPIPSNLRFLDGIDKIKFSSDSGLVFEQTDAVIVVDLNDISRVKALRDSIEKCNGVKIVVDHHLEPKDFADYYLIDTTASSTGEILYKLFKEDKDINWTAPLCEALYVAIMTDTGNFRFERTDGEVHRIVADLIDFGVDPVKLYNVVYNTMPLNTARLLGVGYSNLESFYDGKLVVMSIRNRDFLLTSTTEEDTEGFVEAMLSIENVVMSILIIEVIERNEIRVSIRSKGEFSARNLALNFNGGGHKNAAGCRFNKMELEEVKKMLVDRAKNILNP
ncbi:MAG: bifunctional oligoribonuclease/PAP phosphatase NrnA [Ignavibacteria bacterium]|nr:bifunctional oligoribonuclease/PAP phosphatase NrnA [Ignavibacteria bacterium]